jgi:DNA-binding GntR family transcriptional regulator
VFGSLQVAHEEHRALTEAAAARDGERVRDVLLAHLRHTERVVTEGYIQANSSPDDTEATR